MEPRLCGASSAMCPIEAMSCVANAQGHLNAIVTIEAVTTFSSFQVL